MTQFQSPPPPPPYPSYGTYEVQEPPRWSGAAIAGFICSLLGFFGITALLGIVLGIVGIFSTSGGRKRGMGLAIVSIPISLVTGAICVFLILGIVMVGRVMRVPTMIKGVMALDSGDLNSATNSLRDLTTTDLNAIVSTEQMQAWFARVKKDHGTLTSLQIDQATQKPHQLPDGRFHVDMDGKFVNGPATVGVTLRIEGRFHLKIDDITIGKSSIRDAGEKPPSN
ncbi:MAG: DUF4190 domain-containing protein [Planctomycetes bacterium]|nr:DUF4190 domain-containing protein [Planctomycetota bacterium]MBI3834161.1 DUF4190 domain-containing protein [Planctomycetota bacterium]